MIIKWFKSLFSIKHPSLYELEEKEYSNEELIEVLKTKNLALRTGNAIVLCLLDRLNKKINECDH